MNLHRYLVQVLEQDPALAELVGNRIYQASMPRKPVFPGIVFDSTDKDQDEVLDGPTDLQGRRVEFTVWAKTAKEARQVKLALTAFLEAHHGAAQGFVVQSAHLFREFCAFDDEKRLSFVEQTWLINTGGEES